MVLHSRLPMDIGAAGGVSPQLRAAGRPVRQCQRELWTLLFWTALFCAALSLLGLAIERSVYTRINGIVCRICCFLISGYFLRHWLQGWWPRASELDHRAWLLMLLIGILYVVIRRRRLLAPMPRPSSVPSWQDCYSLAILPLLLVTAVIHRIQNHRPVNR